MLTFEKKLGRYFKLGEMLQWREDNTPTDEQLVNMTQLCCCCLDVIRSRFFKEYGYMEISSGFRNNFYNSKAGSKPTSQHLKGEAADFNFSNCKSKESLKKIFDWIREYGTYDQLIYEVKNVIRDGKTIEIFWIHISYKIEKNRNQPLTFIHNNMEIVSIK